MAFGATLKIHKILILIGISLKFFYTISISTCTCISIRKCNKNGEFSPSNLWENTLYYSTTHKTNKQINKMIVTLP